MSAVVDIKDIAASGSAASSFNTPFQGTMGGSTRSYGKSTATGGIVSNPVQDNHGNTDALASTAKADGGGYATSSTALNALESAGNFIKTYAGPLIIGGALLVGLAVWGFLRSGKNKTKDKQ